MTFYILHYCKIINNQFFFSFPLNLLCIYVYVVTQLTKPIQSRERERESSSFMASMKPLKSTFLITLSLLLSLHLSQTNADEDQTTVDLHSKGLLLVKTYCLIILFITTFAGGVSPYFYRWNESFLLLGTQFAGGVFLGTSLMHFLSDSVQTFGDLTTKSYPFSYMLAAAGYLLTMFGDCVVVFVTTRSGERDVKVELEGGEGRKDEEEAVEERKEEVGSTHTHLNPVMVGTTSLGDAILLILALCFHSVFEGIAVGVAGTYTYWSSTLRRIFIF